VADPTLPALFEARLARDPGAPLVTFYDDATGERAELSAKSLANWIAKTYSMLTDSLGLGPGDTAQLSLPVHWLAVPVLFGCWYAGLAVQTGRPTSVAFADASSLGSLAAADEVFAISLRPMAQPDAPPPGAEDFTTAVRPMPDAWAGVRSLAGPADPALAGLSHAELADTARRQATELGLAAGGRLLWTQPWRQPGDWIAALLAPLAVGGSTVLVGNPDAGLLDRRASAERVTVRH
jgi:uncharacterized protein (TIGR03089 family)